MYLAALLIFATLTLSQNNSSSAGVAPSGSTNTICNESISNANASGVFPYRTREWNSWTREWESKGLNHSWAITVTGGNGQDIEREFWYETAGKNYADDLALGIDVCAFADFDIPLNAHRLGQNDSGNCSAVFTKRCIDGVLSVAAASAQRFAVPSSPPPYTNLTAGVLPAICRYIAKDLEETIREVCGPQLPAKTGSKTGHFASSLALTGYNSSNLYSDNCTMSAGDRTYYPVDFDDPVLSPEVRAGSNAGYDDMTSAITPVLTVFMPVANMDVPRNGSWNDAVAVLQCLRPSNFSEGSRVAPALAEGTPWPKPGALSVGAKGGIAAGVVGFSLATGGVLLYLWLAKRRKRAEAVEAILSDSIRCDDDSKMPPEADAAFGVHELAPNDRKPELDDAVVSELGSSGCKPSELANTSAPVELPADDTQSG